MTDLINDAVRSRKGVRAKKFTPQSLPYSRDNNSSFLSKQTTLQNSPYTFTPIPNRKSANGSSSLNNSSYTDASTIINAAIDNLTSNDDADDSSYRVRNKTVRRKIGKNSSGEDEAGYAEPIALSIKSK
ncbi:hypothetical protein TSAR_002080 [Trichomalopsis sarcophagae]|uniref:Uncharacterized protein n=1 Tax=Trichomalopsis sarcophagae TaxID=543379 RepID=A0A232FEU5_9HYME|nr:hypothetical protein TSAR_002080 [Trichomalopsis sarcophagae]